MTARAVVDLGAIARNVGRLAALAPRAAACAVVKADGYGHGAGPVAEAALRGGATWLAVATPTEAVALADSGIDPTVPILLLSEPDPDALAEIWPRRPAALRCTVSSARGVETVERLARGEQAVPLHLKIDTGMHRMGVDPAEAPALCDLIAGAPHVDLEGLWTHFAIADDPTDDFTAVQTARFDAAARAVEQAGHRAGLHHLCNSAATIAHPGAHRDLVRLGIAMYGVAPSESLAGRVELEPALRLSATVTGLRTVAVGESVSYGRRWFADAPTRVATLDIGYADGVRRNSPAAGVEVIIRGHRCPMVGVVTMDQTMVAVTDEAALGDEAVLIGRSGDECITAEELGSRLDTIGYEVLTDLGPRVRRDHRA